MAFMFLVDTTRTYRKRFRVARFERRPRVSAPMAANCQLRRLA